MFVSGITEVNGADMYRWVRFYFILSDKQFQYVKFDGWEMSTEVYTKLQREEILCHKS